MDAVALVFSLTDIDSLMHLHEHICGHMAQGIIDKTTLLYAVGNKCDLPDHIDRSTIDEVCSDLSISQFYYTSAKTSRYVQDFVERIADSIHRKRLLSTQKTCLVS